MRYCLVLDLLLISLCASGQYYQKRGDRVRQDTLFRQITITLSPIIMENGKYYFDGRRVKFEEVVLPLISLHDPVVDRRLKIVRTLTDLQRPIFYATFAYGVYALGRVHVNRHGTRTALYTIVGILAFRALEDLVASAYKRRAINAYNKVVIQPMPSIGAHGTLGLGLVATF